MRSKRFSLYPLHREWQKDTWKFASRDEDKNLQKAVGVDGSQYVIAPTAFWGLPLVAWRRNVRDEVIFFKSFADLAAWLGLQGHSQGGDDAR